MKKLYPSGRTVIYAIFAMAFTLLFFFVLFASWSLYRQTKADSQAEGQGELTAIVTETTLRLNSVHGHLTELLLTVENQSNQLLSSGEMEPVLAKYACKDMMDSKLYSSSDIGLLYVYNVSRDIFFVRFQCSCGIGATGSGTSITGKPSMQHHWQRYVVGGRDWRNPFLFPGLSDWRVYGRVLISRFSL